MALGSQAGLSQRCPRRPAGHYLSGKNGLLSHARTTLSASISTAAHTPASRFLLVFFPKVYLNVVHLAPGSPPCLPHSQPPRAPCQHRGQTSSAGELPTLFCWAPDRHSLISRRSQTLAGVWAVSWPALECSFTQLGGCPRPFLAGKMFPSFRLDRHVSPGGHLKQHPPPEGPEAAPG